jgi:hypothetical protein
MEPVFVEEASMHDGYTRYGVDAKARLEGRPVAGSWLARGG